MILEGDSNDDEATITPYDVSCLLERFAETMTPMEDECISKLQRSTELMQSNELETFTPELGRFPELLLENTAVRSSLTASFAAMRSSTSLRTVQFAGFPSRELELGLSNLPRNLERLEILHTSRSQSIRAEALYDLPPTLKKIQCDARIVIKHAKERGWLAKCFVRLEQLEHFEIHVLPRIRQDSEFRLDVLLQSLQRAQLQVLKLTAGYEHNYNTIPLIAPEILEHFLRKVNTLVDLQLDNFGLRDPHLRFLPPTLRKLRLAKHHPEAFTPNRFILEDSELEECIFWTELETQMRKEQYAEFHQYQEQLHLHCLIRKCWNSTEGAVSTAAASTDRLALSALYAIVRYNPTMLVLTGE